MAIQQLSLKTVPIQFNPFAGTQYEYKTPDLSILERSLAQREARVEKAYQQMGAVDSALSSVEQQLNPAESNWFYNYKNNIKQQIKSNIDEGNPGAAIRNAMKLAGDTATDSAILSRIDANKKYQEWDNTLKQRLAKHEISSDTYKYAIANNPYQFNETTNAFGNVVGGQLVDPKQVYDTINWKDVAAQAAALNRPDTKTEHYGGGGTNPALYDTKDSNMNKLNGMLGAASSKWENGYQIEQVTSEEILNTIGNLLNIPDLTNQVIQDWEVSKWKYNQLDDVNKQELKEAGLIKNGVPVSLKEYLDEKTKLFADALAYKKEGITSVKESGFGFTSKTGTNVENSNPEGYGKPKTPAPPQVHGKPIRMVGEKNISVGANAAGSALDNMMTAPQDNIKVKPINIGG